MDWFLYDNGLRHERVKEKTRVVSEHANIVILWLLSLDLPKISKDTQAILRGHHLWHLFIFRFKEQ